MPSFARSFAAGNLIVGGDVVAQDIDAETVNADNLVGPHTGDSTGSAADFATYNGRALYSGPTFLPAAAEWPGVVGWSPTWLTRGRELAGNAQDEIGANHLTAAGTIAYDASRRAHRGQSIITNASGFSLAAVNDFAATNAVFGLWFAVTDAVAAQRSYLGRWGTTVYSLISVQGTGGLSKLWIQAHDGTTAKAFTLDKVMADGVPRLVTMQIDRTMNTIRGRCSAPGEAAVAGSVDITGWGTLAGGTAPAWVYGYVPAVQNGDDCWLGGAFARINADMTGANVLANLAVALGAE